MKNGQLWGPSKVTLWWRERKSLVFRRTICQDCTRSFHACSHTEPSPPLRKHILVLPFSRSSTPRKQQRQNLSPGLSISYLNTSPIKPRVKELKDFQTQMILSSLLLVEGQDPAGKGACGKYGPAIKMRLTMGFDLSPRRTVGPWKWSGVTILSAPETTASWTTRKTDEDFQSKFQRKREKWPNTKET